MKLLTLISEFKLKNNVQAALEALGRLGFLRILITNQPDISYGLMEKDEHELIMSDIKKLPLDDIFVCLHGRDDGCECKKPKPGMFKQAADKHNVDFKRSYAIGDRSNDLEPAHNLGCKTILLTSEQSQNVTADFTASDLLEGVAIIKNDYENFY